jgi:hypothetical protein
MNPFAPKSVLIRNEDKTLVPQFQKLTLNFLPAQTRIEMLEDREHTVIPMVMLTEGVHNGSGGPLLYNTEELSKTPEVWNHKPIVVYHPELNGHGISACDPVVVNQRKVGVMMNTAWDGKLKRLKSEAWIEKTRAETIDGRIFAALKKKEMMEISTGLFSDLEKSTGQWNGEDYDGIVRNIRPDHLALLPDKIGACSIAKGAGLLRNELSDGKMDPKQMLKRLSSFLGLTDNEMSFENTRQMIQTALRARLTIPGTGLGIGGSPVNQPPFMWVEAVYSNFFVYEKDGKLFRLGYSSSDAGISLSEDDPVEVVRVTEYRTVDGAKFVGNDQPKPQDSDTMNKAKMIIAILAANAGWSDQKVLEGLNDKQIESIHNGVVKPPEPVVNEARKTLVDAIIKQNEYGWTESDRPALMTFNDEQLAKFKLTAPVKPPTTNTQPPVPVTLEAWLGSAPPEVAGTIRSLLGNEQTAKNLLIEKIVKNEDLGFKKEDLAGMTIANLQKIGKMADKPAQTFQPFQAIPDYSGMAPSSQPLGNEGPSEEEVLIAPVLNFQKESRKGKETAAA